MEFEKKLKTKTILAVVTVLLILCSVYFYLGIQNQRQYRDWQIQKDNEIVCLEIKNLLYNTNSLYREKIKFFVNNPEIRKEFATINVDELYRKALPLYSVLKSENPFHFIINFYGPDNLSVLLLDIGPNASVETAPPSSFVAKVNATSKPASGFEYLNSQLYYKIVEPLFYDGKYLGCIEFGLRENEVAESIAKKFNVQIASVFDKKIVSPLFLENSTNQNSNKDLIIHTLYNSPVLSKISIQNNKLTKERFKFNDKYYFSNLVQVQNQFHSEGFVGIVFAKDITQLENQFQVTIYRSLLIIILILIAVSLILHFSFNIILHKLFNLQDNLDKRLEEKSKEIIKTNAELNQIFNTTGNSMRLIDTNFNILRVNRTFTMMSGISKENAEGRKCYEVFPGPFCHTAECPLVRIMNGEERVEQDIQKKNTSGLIIPGIITSVAFKASTGEVLGIIEDFKDISKRLEIEEALKRTEQQFSLFMDNIPVGVFIKDDNGKMLYINKYVKRSVLSDKSIGKLPKELFSEKYANRIIKEDHKVVAGEILALEEELPDFSGNLNSFLTHKFRFRNADNQWQIGGVMVDITNKKKTELQLKILSNAIQHSPTCVIITNLKGKIEIVNQSFTQITGYSTNDVIGKEISILRSEELSKSIYQDIMDIVITGVDWQGEFQNIKKNGEKYWELASISPVKNEKGEITHFVFISEDITKRKHNEKELILAKEKAEEADRLKSAFLSNLSHEIRTPMNAIIGFSNLLLDEDLAFEERVKLNNLINENGFSLLKIIDDVIDISKIQSGSFEIKKSDCQVNKLITELYTEFNNKIEADENKEIRLSVNKGVRRKGFTISTDVRRLRQVLNNLIENAVKFTSKGFVEFGYSIIEKNTIQFYVIDSGIGIAHEKFEHIYDLFRQADESFTREYGGMGIGLTIAKKIIQHLGGEIWAQSTPNQGTTIYFTLPLEPAEHKFEKSNDDETQDFDFNWQNKVVLVAEDLPINYTFIEEALIPTKAKIIWAKDGKQAVEMCMQNDQIDLVLMDIKMPVMDGFEAARIIKQHNKNLKIIGQTAYVHNNEEKQCSDAGFDNYISKPITIESLLHAISQAFSQN
ncbi:MAG: PAS domain S-box protein [Bacteroidales bacterium]